MPEAAMMDAKPRAQTPSVITRRPLWEQAYVRSTREGEQGGTHEELYVCSAEACEPLSDALARLIALDEVELAQLAALPELAVEFTAEERSLYERAIASLNYFGDWADPAQTRDSIVLSCKAPRVIGGEYTCPDGAFKPERAALHARIMGTMLPSPPGGAEGGGGGGVGMKRAYVVVGVPGSGKDSVLKRHLRRANAGIELTDASADRLKGYLAQWGDDELSFAVRQHCRKHGYSKQLLHAQYMHRESIYVVQRLVAQAGEDALLATADRRAGDRAARRRVRGPPVRHSHLAAQELGVPQRARKVGALLRPPHLQGAGRAGAAPVPRQPRAHPARPHARPRRGAGPLLDQPVRRALGRVEAAPARAAGAHAAGHLVRVRAQRGGRDARRPVTASAHV
ncbi:hypothetical protein T492DRAFT_249210 [Pavlovales sp. CCMP2436]|nr:hypothetical protein T492DRAFT_249210 [Pavlovales sp. CCMP2436]